MKFLKTFAFFYFALSPSSARTETCKNLSVKIGTDGWPQEISWEVKDSVTDSVLYVSPQYQRSFTIYEQSGCINQSCMYFRIIDSYRDGLSYPGYYEVTYDGNLVAVGGAGRGGGPYSEVVSNSFGSNCVSSHPSVNPSVTPTLLPSIVPSFGPSSIPTMLPTSKSAPTGECKDITVKVNTDFWPKEISWEVKDSVTNTVLLRNGTYRNIFTLYQDTQCIERQCLKFHISDVYGDGISLGYYEVSYDGEVVVEGGYLRGGSSFFEETSEPFGSCSTLSPTTKLLTSSPSASPTISASNTPTSTPTFSPSTFPTLYPTRRPSVFNPSAFPTTAPTSISPGATFNPSTSRYPSTSPVLSPSGSPSAPPTLSSSLSPSTNPTFTPSASPSATPTFSPFSSPSINPSLTFSDSPTGFPSLGPSVTPSKTQSQSPSTAPIKTPTQRPSAVPHKTPGPTSKPSAAPIKTTPPTFNPSAAPSNTSTRSPSIPPTKAPTRDPSAAPSNTPTRSPSIPPTKAPTRDPSAVPIMTPTVNPSAAPVRDPKNFEITLVKIGGGDEFDNAFNLAKLRWEEIIKGDLPDQPRVNNPNFDWFAGEWPGQGVNIAIDDLLIGYEFTEIDGRGGVLGFAGPKYARQEPTAITTISGIMKFDIADFESSSQNDAFLIILHEMGHVLGLGTYLSFLCGTNCSNGDDAYTCNQASAEYRKIFGQDSSLALDVQSCGHWSEGSFLTRTKSELMTPLFEAGKYQPLSTVSVAALADIGYEVDLSAADPWSLGRSPSLLDPHSTSSFILNEKNMIKPSMTMIQI